MAKMLIDIRGLEYNQLMLEGKDAIALAELIAKGQVVKDSYQDSIWITITPAKISMGMVINEKFMSQAQFDKYKAELAEMEAAVDPANKLESPTEA